MTINSTYNGKRIINTFDKENMKNLLIHSTYYCLKDLPKVCIGVDPGILSKIEDDFMELCLNDEARKGFHFWMIPSKDIPYVNDDNFGIDINTKSFGNKGRHCYVRNGFLYSSFDNLFNSDEVRTWKEAKQRTIEKHGRLPFYYKRVTIHIADLIDLLNSYELREIADELRNIYGEEND